MKPRAITVFGSAQPTPGSTAYEEARTLGRLLAEARFTVINGGYTGTMQGASQGATEAGGKAIGITCALFDSQRPRANPFLSEAIHTPDLFARLRQLTGRGDGFVVLNGGVGTMLELLLVWNLLAIGVVDRPCVLVGKHWRRVLTDLERETQIGARHSALLQVVDTVEEAVRLLKSTLDG